MRVRRVPACGHELWRPGTKDPAGTRGSSMPWEFSAFMVGTIPPPACAAIRVQCARRCGFPAALRAAGPQLISGGRKRPLPAHVGPWQPTNNPARAHASEWRPDNSIVLGTAGQATPGRAAALRKGERRVGSLRRRLGLGDTVRPSSEQPHTRGTGCRWEVPISPPLRAGSPQNPPERLWSASRDSLSPWPVMSRCSRSASSSRPAASSCLTASTS